jgi:hypothetical protein
MRQKLQIPKLKMSVLKRQNACTDWKHAGDSDPPAPKAAKRSSDYYLLIQELDQQFTPVFRRHEGITYEEPESRFIVNAIMRIYDESKKMFDYNVIKMTESLLMRYQKGIFGECINGIQPFTLTMDVTTLERDFLTQSRVLRSSVLRDLQHIEIQTKCNTLGYALVKCTQNKEYHFLALSMSTTELQEHMIYPYGNVVPDGTITINVQLLVPSTSDRGSGYECYNGDTCMEYEPKSESWRVFYPLDGLYEPPNYFMCKFIIN